MEKTAVFIDALKQRLPPNSTARAEGPSVRVCVPVGQGRQVEQRVALVEINQTYLSMSSLAECIEIAIMAKAAKHIVTQGL